MSDDAPTPRSTKHSDETRAACMAALLAGQGIDRVAADYQIPLGTLKQWRSEARKALGHTDAMQAKQEKVAGLLLDFVTSTLTTLKKQQAVFSDPEWLKQQPAESLAVLHGVQTDKVMRLLEALAGRFAGPADAEPAGAPVAVIEAPV